ncbi:hypothetical protein BU16DRAFT_591750 [Lophium mytilinum]|uniref:F-box domain-containing protein n=1 Tax=Lophium mytilinum TaxID=390894 RepID=A0A6A6QMK9_9PEZI|nr:hypothetical protein BU16DRAFT_591750 [Lophium mytilinum]
MDHTTPFNLLSLPAELRESIYLFSFSTRRPDAVHPPAITLTNHLIRSESLPLFYKTQRFALNLLTETSISRITSWLHRLTPSSLLLIRRWTFLVNVDCYAYLNPDVEVAPLQALTYIGVAIDLDACYPRGRVREIRTPAVYAWQHATYNAHYMNALKTPLSRAEIERSDAAALGFGGFLTELAGQVERLWGKRAEGVLGVEDYKGLFRFLRAREVEGIMGFMRARLVVHPGLSGGRGLGSREAGRRLAGLAEGFMEAVEGEMVE